MNHDWSRREVLQSLSMGVIAGNGLLAVAARAAVAAPPARCMVFNYRGEPLRPEEFAQSSTIIRHTSTR
jgi:hypothetical protein